ncbi:MAG: DUF6290 family protein [Coriobacteriia bacterium]|nr:DUF6290 family protein [Coriobacteriia bacterium]MCL2749443.1 DUF6290 family protein [Coriobacteriia bacterium]
MASTTMTIRLDVEDKNLIADYAGTFGKTVSDFMREAALERIEDELDLKAWDEAKKEFEGDPVSYSAEEIAAKYQ